MPADAEAFFMFYILFSCLYFSFNYTFVEEVEMNPNQTKLRGSRYYRTYSKDFITCFLYFSLPWSCCRLTVCFILEDHSSTEGLLFKVWNTSVLNPGPLFFFCCVTLGRSFDFTVPLSPSIIWDYESQSLGMTDIKQYLLDLAEYLKSWTYSWSKLPA